MLILVQGINFLVTLFVLNLLLFKPIRGILKKRRELMDSQLKNIETFSSQAETKLADYEEQLAAARKEGMDIRNTFRDEGAGEEQSILSAAGEEAAATMKAARAEIEAQTKAAMDSLSKEVDAFAAKATDKILGQA